MTNQQALQNKGSASNETYTKWLAEKETERPLREARGQSFAQAREAAGISRHKMAKLTGLAWKTIDNFERGEVVARPKFVEIALWNSLQLDEIKSVGKVMPAILSMIFQWKQAHKGKVKDAAGRAGNGNASNPVKPVNPFTLFKNII